jgi:hypothetical protein
MKGQSEGGSSRQAVRGTGEAAARHDANAWSEEVRPVAGITITITSSESVTWTLGVAEMMYGRLEYCSVLRNC